MAVVGAVAGTPCDGGPTPAPCPLAGRLVEDAACFSNIADGSLAVWSRQSPGVRIWRVSLVDIHGELEVFYRWVLFLLRARACDVLGTAFCVQSG